MNPLKNSKKKKFSSNRFSTVATNAFVHALEFAKIVHGELVLLHSFELPIYDNQFFFLKITRSFTIH
jgi:hypothetical protein